MAVSVVFILLSRAPSPATSYFPQAHAFLKNFPELPFSILTDAHRPSHWPQSPDSYIHPVTRLIPLISAAAPLSCSFQHHHRCCGCFPHNPVSLIIFSQLVCSDLLPVVDLSFSRVCLDLFACLVAAL